MFRLPDLILERVIFEARFRNGYLYWDNCGQIWRSLSEKWPDLTAVGVTPERAHFKLGPAAIEATLSHQNFGTHQDYPEPSEKLDFYRSFTNLSSDIIFSTLQISTFTRIGNRYRYIHKCDTSDDVTDFLTTKKFVGIPDPIRNLGKKIIEPSVRFVVENEDISTTIHIGFEKRELNIEIPKPLKVDTSAFIGSLMFIDIDSFTTKPVDRGTFSADEYISSHARNTRNIIERLLI